MASSAHDSFEHLADSLSTVGKRAGVRAYARSTAFFCGFGGDTRTPPTILPFIDYISLVVIRRGNPPVSRVVISHIGDTVGNSGTADSAHIGDPIGDPGTADSDIRLTAICG